MITYFTFKGQSLVRFIMKKSILILSSFIFITSIGAQGVNEASTKDVYNGKEGKITAYISGPATMLEALEKTFEADKGDVLDIVQLGCGPLRQRVWAESESGCINADVFWGSDPLIYNVLAEKGAIEAYTPKGYENFANKYKVNKPYTLVNERYGVLIYNKDKVKSKLTSFFDLANVEYKNQIVHADPTQSSTALALISALWDIEEPGGTYYKKLINNGLFLAKKNSDVPSKIQEGEFIVGIAPHDAVWRLQKQAKQKGYETQLALSWPEEGAIAIQRPIAISKNNSRYEKNEELAKAFVDFLVSPKAQKITTNFGFISVLKNAEMPNGLPKNIKVLDIDWDELGSKQNQINEEFEKLF